MSNLENELREEITSLESKLRESVEHERQLNELIRYYKGRVDLLVHAARKEGRVHVFGENSDPSHVNQRS